MARLLTLILINFLLFSCAAKKVAISNSVVETRVDSTVVSKKDSVFFNKNSISIKESIDEIEIVPLDTAKPVVIDGKQYFNATLKFKKTKREVIDTTKTEVSVSDYTQTEVLKEENKESFSKDLDKKPSLMNMAWLLLIPIVIFAIRLFLKK